MCVCRICVTLIGSWAFQFDLQTKQLEINQISNLYKPYFILLCHIFIACVSYSEETQLFHSWKSRTHTQNRFMTGWLGIFFYIILNKIKRSRVIFLYVKISQFEICSKTKLHPSLYSSIYLFVITIIFHGEQEHILFSYKRSFLNRQWFHFK